MHSSISGANLWRLWLLIAITVAAIFALVAYGPITQDVSYHRFADQRTIFGVSNLWNVASNLPFLVVGLYGSTLLIMGYSGGRFSHLRSAYAAFFAALMLVAAGSTYYHLNPSDATLIWDRLPMTLAFMAYFAAILGEHVHLSLVRNTLAPLLGVGVCSVVWWRLSGDLRPYVLVQYLPVILIPVIAVLFPSRLPGARLVWAVLLAYAVAKALEFFDAPVYLALGFSGHSLKHIAAAIGVFFVVLVVKTRGIHAAPA